MMSAKAAGRRTKYSHLVTPEHHVRRGFETHRRLKQQAARRYRQEARRFEELLDRLSCDPAILTVNAEVRPYLAAAASLSDKARKHYTAEQETAAVVNYLRSISGSRDRRGTMLESFLLTKGEARGGNVRNTFARCAEKRFVRAVVAALRRGGLEYRIERCGARAKSITWPGRCLLFDTQPFTGRKLDFLLVAADSADEAKAAARREDMATAWLAYGELKSGIDTAGADEHWKTHSGQIVLTRRRLKRHRSVPAFFLGAHITRMMAREIHGELRTGKLARAANTTSPEQVESLVDWLVGL